MKQNYGKQLVGMLGALLLVGSLLSSTGHAVTPAGTVISNFATVTYMDAGGNSVTTQSNTFTITVSQVAGVSLTPATQTLQGVHGNQVQFPHTIKNTGNGTDTFNLTATPSGSVTLTSIEIFRDDNGDGLASPGEPGITSVSLAMNQSQMIVMRGTIPGTAVPPTSGIITLTTASVFGPAITAASTDTANVVSTAVISLSKSVSASSVNPGGTLDYTINYNNTGIASTSGVPVTLNSALATLHVVRDVLPANTTFASLLGTPSPAGGTFVYHETTASPDTYVTTPPSSFDAVAYVFGGSMVGGQSGTFSFKVTVAGSAQVGTISNTAVMQYNNGSANTSQTSNTTVTSVNLVANVNLYTDSPQNDIQIVASGNAGSSVSFINEAQNMGNGADRFNLTVSPGTFPAGTVFTLLKGDGITPFMDSNGDGTPDTGLLSASATSTVVMKATLPANATGAGPFTATVTATSVANPAVFNAVTDQLNVIVPAGVNVTNTAPLPGGTGTGLGPEGTPQLSVTGNPGATVNIDLHVNNTGPTTDNFNLEFSNVGLPFAPGTLPAGITAITFFIGDGSGNPTGGAITSTGPIPAGGDKEIIAQVTVSSSVSGGTSTDLFFRGISPSSAASDIIYDQLTVNTIRGITLAVSQSNQTSPNGAVTYPHVLTNTGNVMEPQINLATTDSASGFVSTVYLDNNGDGAINGTDTIITSILNLGVGSSTSLIVRVVAPSSAANGAVNNTIFTATPTLTVNSVGPSAAQSNTDTTTIVNGQIQLTLLASPSGSQPPGTEITYTFTYRNIGAAAANSAVITNAIPVNTTYVAGSMKLGLTILGDGVESPVADAGTLIGDSKGSVQFTLGTVGAGSSGTVSFKVTID